MMRIPLLCAALTSIWCIAADDKGAVGPSHPEAQQIQGVWSFITSTEQGLEKPLPRDFRLVISEDEMRTVAAADDGMAFKYTIDPTKNPKAMDWSIEIDPGKPIQQPAIYSLEGDTLRIAHAASGKPRPVDFVSRKGDSGGVWVLRRVR